MEHYNDSDSESKIVQALTEDPGRIEESDADHLERMTDYKSYSKVIFAIKIILQDQTLITFQMVAQGLMDIALLTANANQLRHTMEICEPFRCPTSS